MFVIYYRQTNSETIQILMSDIIKELSNIHRMSGQYYPVDLNPIFIGWSMKIDIDNVDFDAKNFTIRNMEEYKHSFCPTTMHDIILCKRFDLLVWCRSHNIRATNKLDNVQYKYPYSIREVLIKLSEISDVEFVDRVINFICLELGDGCRFGVIDYDYNALWEFISLSCLHNNINILRWYLHYGIEKIGNIFNHYMPYDTNSTNEFRNIYIYMTRAINIEIRCIIHLIYLKSILKCESMLDKLNPEILYFCMDLLPIDRKFYGKWYALKDERDYLINNTLNLPLDLIHIISSYCTTYDINR